MKRRNRSAAYWAGKLIIGFFGLTIHGATVYAQQTAPPERNPQNAAGPTPTDTYPQYQVNGQTTFTVQHLFPFTSPYSGINSLQSRNETELSDSYTLYIGARLNRALEIYIDPEEVAGKGIGRALGLAGFTSGEVIRNPTLSQEPYLGRYLVRWNIRTGQGEQKLDAAQNQVAGTVPAHRLIVTAGKLSVPDIFDINAYANNARTQFMNWALLNNGAYDYAADTRGYTSGVAVEWVNPTCTLRAGSFQMPTVANGINLANNIADSRGDQVEAEVHPKLLPAKSAQTAVVRLLGYRNIADMGSYRAAIALGQETGTTPDITAVRHVGAIKYGGGLNAEQGLSDDGDTGVWLRAGWDDGATESFAYTEIDRTVSGGVQVSGKRWRRPRDRYAIALDRDELSAAHRDYLADGGLGFILGDGRLNYAPEDIVETYYAYAISQPITLSLDYQQIADPGYNRDRGPVSVVSLRLHGEF